MTDFDAKLNRRHRNDWSGQQIEVEVTDDGERVLRISIGRRDGYRKGDPTEYEVKVVNPLEGEHVLVTLLELSTAEEKVAQ